MKMSTTVFILLFVIFKVQAEYGVLRAQSIKTGQSDHFCFAYNSLFKPIPTALNSTNYHQLYDLSDVIGCNETDYVGHDVTNKVVAVARGNCSFTEKALLAQSHHAVAMLAVSDNLMEPGANKSAGDYDKVNIIVGVVSKKDFTNIVALGGSVSIWMYSPSSPRIDPNMVLIYAIALSCIVIGAYWSGRTRYSAIEKQCQQRRGSGGSLPPSERQEEDHSPILNINACVILILFLFICTMLVLLYFFYDYLVYVVIGLFCLAGTIGLYNCLLPLWTRVIRSDCRIPENKLPLCKEQPEIRNVVLALLCIGFSVFWAIMRKQSYAWILQDILGFAFCVNMMNTILLPHLMSCTILLVLLLCYDIFFVFITPLFTKDGNSVMVDVATGGSSHSGEQLPMVFKVPRFMAPADSVCYQNNYSLLGFGDVIVPGLLIAYNHGFDLMMSTRKAYFIGSSIAYGVGLIITYVALALMETGQPALLYLVPCTLITTVLIGCKRGELRQLWTGKACPKKNDDIRPDGQCVPPSQTGSDSETSSLSGDGERRGLINA